MASNLKEFYFELIIRTIEENPNDSTLGEKLRAIYYDIPDRFKPKKNDEEKDLHRV